METKDLYLSLDQESLKKKKNQKQRERLLCVLKLDGGVGMGVGKIHLLRSLSIYCINGFRKEET